MWISCGEPLHFMWWGSLDTSLRLSERLFKTAPVEFSPAGHGLISQLANTELQNVTNMTDNSYMWKYWQVGVKSLGEHSILKSRAELQTNAQMQPTLFEMRRRRKWILEPLHALTYFLLHYQHIVPCGHVHSQPSIWKTHAKTMSETRANAVISTFVQKAKAS